ncbi:MAG: hypothetical protein WC846_02910 [Candidatus Gracilibacteria bacterium]|jgi:uncharacterized membrane protein
MENATQGSAQNQVQNPNLFAALAYVPLLFILTMLQKGDDSVHVWHAKNGAGLFAASICLTVVVQILFGILPLSLLGVFALVAWVIRVLILVAVVYGAWNAWNGKQWNIPVLTPYAQKIPLEKWFKKVAVVSAPEAPVAPVEPAPEAAPVAPIAPAAPVAPSEPTQATLMPEDPTTPTTPAA